MDGNFGLVHKRSAAKSTEPPKTTLMFLPDEFVEKTAKAELRDTVEKSVQVYNKIERVQL